MLEWRIYPTSVKVENEPQESRELSRNPRDQGDQNAEEPDGPVSRQQLFHDLLKDRRREIHVEDFLWTGSGKLILNGTKIDLISLISFRPKAGLSIRIAFYRETHTVEVRFRFPPKLYAIGCVTHLKMFRKSM